MNTLRAPAPIPDGVIYARELHMRARPERERPEMGQNYAVQTIKLYTQILKYVFNVNSRRGDVQLELLQNI